jgi:hypothetical protein
MTILLALHGSWWEKPSHPTRDSPMESSQIMARLGNRDTTNLADSTELFG